MLHSEATARPRLRFSLPLCADLFSFWVRATQPQTKQSNLGFVSRAVLVLSQPPAPLGLVPSLVDISEGSCGMKQIEDGRPDEAGKEQSCNESPTFDDIYVPGIGVRAALDDDSPAGPGFLSEVAQRRIRAAAFLNRQALGIVENVLGVRTRLASTLRSASTQIRSATAAQRARFRGPRFRGPRFRGPSFRGHLTSASRRTLQQIHSRFLNAAGKVDARLRTTTRKLSVSTELATSAASRKLRIVGARSLLVMRRVRVPVRRGSKYRLHLPSVPPTVAIGRNLRRAHSSLRCAVAGAGTRLRPMADYVADYKMPLRFHETYRLDRLRLRRAVPPLAVLAVIVMFVIEEIATVVRH